jgi:hypothetical protein
VRVAELKVKVSVIMEVPVGRVKVSCIEPSVAPLLAFNVASTVNSPSHVYPSSTPIWYVCIHAVIVSVDAKVVV